jgi:hypothetical protein
MVPFDPKISLGNLLSIASMVGLTATAYFDLKTDVRVIQNAQAATVTVNADTLVVQRADLTRVERKIDWLIDRFIDQSNRQPAR